MTLRVLTNAVETLNDETENMYLNFSIDNELYGFEIRNVIQIIGMREIIQLPEMPYGMKGFIILRGNVVPVVSMRARFGKMEADCGERACIVIVQVRGKEIGLIVDAIQETITILPESILPPPSMGEGMNGPYIMGIARLANDRVAILIDLRKLLV